jgi:hypothetical protein
LHKAYAAQENFFLVILDLVQGFDDRGFGSAALVVFHRLDHEPVERGDQVGRQVGQQTLTDDLRGLCRDEVGFIAERMAKLHEMLGSRSFLAERSQPTQFGIHAARFRHRLEHRSLPLNTPVPPWLWGFDPPRQQLFALRMD